MMRFFRFQSEDGLPATPESRILQRRFRHPSALEAKTFQIDADAQVMQLERLRSIDRGLIERIQALVGQVEVDLDAPLSPDDE